MLPALGLANMKKPELENGLNADSRWLPDRISAQGYDF
jgi:hypothetical protein